jgi:hypothetical protein
MFNLHKRGGVFKKKGAKKWSGAVPSYENQLF